MGLPNIDLTSIDGKTESLTKYDGHFLLVVNVASFCGFTPQYEDLQKLYEELKDKKFQVLGFPCNQFGAQEPGGNKEIKEFCEKKYRVTFPLYAKISVNGPDTHELFKFLKNQAQGFLGSKSIKWNFTKFLIDNHGSVIGRYAPQTSIIEIKKDLVPLLFPN
ncbi:MAG: glutathione peroxidase [Betaproteobacteria bacterium TMED82]|nr:MAG: glutathione peroxidase [Betaproteobacteria bacterium TMED82]|tara:strand:+ start:2574 stop:3059 length:486 start_codon:yes stop_codon:yes gene_type:complete